MNHLCPENIKLALIAASALLAQLGSSMLTITAGSEVDRWLERGGTTVCIAILLYLLKLEREDKKALISKLETIIEEDREEREKGTESRVQLNCSIKQQIEASEKHSVAIDKLSQIIDRKLP
jgi:hypothetical protein